jgi:hypothetical protein
MLSCRWGAVWVVACVGVAGLTCGCAKTRLAEADVPESRRTADEIREQYQRLNPGNRVGVVLAVRPQDNLAAVGDIAIADFRLGDTLVFMDTNERPLNHSGTVVNVVENALHLKYERLDRSGGREPRPGDLAVRLVLGP